MEEIETLMQPEDVAAKLGVSVAKVRSWIETGDLQCLPGGRKKYISRAQLEAFLAGDRI